MKRRFIIFLVLAAGLVLGLVWLRSRGSSQGRAVEAFKKELLAKGEKLTMVELAPRGSNDANAASQFMNLMTPGPSPTNLPVMMPLVAPGVAEYVRATPVQMVGYETNRSRMAKLREIPGLAALGFNLNYSLGSQIGLPHIAQLGRAERLAAGTAMQALAADDFTEARLDLLAAVDLARADEDEPRLVSGMTRNMRTGLAVAATWELLPDNRWTEAQLAELQGRWQASDLTRGIEPALVMERAMRLGMLAEGRESRQRLTALQYGGARPPPGGSLYDQLGQKLDELGDRVGYQMWKSSWSWTEELYLLQLVEVARQPERQFQKTGAFAAALMEFEIQVANLKLRYEGSLRRFQVSEDLDLNIRAFLLGTTEAETSRRLAVTAIALKRHQLAHGAYPAALGDLVPTYLTAVPADPMDGRPLHYQLRADGGFLLYSAGLDGEDNGGGDVTPQASLWNSLSAQANGQFRNMTNVLGNGRDIVWPRAATTKEVEDFHSRATEATNGVGK